MNSHELQFKSKTPYYRFYFKNKEILKKEWINNANELKFKYSLMHISYSADKQLQYYYKPKLNDKFEWDGISYHTSIDHKSKCNVPIKITFLKYVTTQWNNLTITQKQKYFDINIINKKTNKQ